MYLMMSQLLSFLARNALATRRAKEKEHEIEHDYLLHREGRNDTVAAAISRRKEDAGPTCSILHFL